MTTTGKGTSAPSAVAAAAAGVAAAAAAAAGLVLYRIASSRGEKREGRSAEGTAGSALTRTTKPRRRLVVVSGCDRGLGRLLAERLSIRRGERRREDGDDDDDDDGEFVVLALTLTEAAAEELNAFGRPSLRAVRCDVTSAADARGARDVAEEMTMGGARPPVMYAVVNNAAIADPGDFAWFEDLGAHRRAMDVNYFGQLELTSALLPLLLRTSASLPGGARIVNVSSVCGASASAGNSAYSASKFAVEAWSDSLRLELKPFNVRVTKVRPGQVSTHIQQDWRSNMLKNYAAAPENIRERYGGDDFSDMVNGIFGSASDAQLTQPAEVVDKLVEILSVAESDLEPCYWIGKDAHEFWRPLGSLPTAESDERKGMFQLRPQVPKPPPPGVVSHVTISVRDLEKSLPFYKAFGLEEYGKPAAGRQFLSLKSHDSKWSTLVLLEEDKDMAPQGQSYDAGMTRLCIYTTSLDKEAERLSTLGLKPMAPTARSRMADVIAFKDPDGFVVYFIEFRGFLAAYARGALWWNERKSPCLFHWTVNVTDAKAGLAAFESLGFVTVSDQNRDQVAFDLLPAFDLSATDTVIERIRMCRRPGDWFVATIMEWVRPRTERKGAELSNGMTLSVADVEEALALAGEAGMETRPAEYRRLPVFGAVLVGTAFVEPGCSPVNFCCFTNKP